jgi:hypothetical protein
MRSGGRPPASALILTLQMAGCRLCNNRDGLLLGRRQRLPKVDPYGISDGVTAGFPKDFQPRRGLSPEVLGEVDARRTPSRALIGPGAASHNASLNFPIAVVRISQAVSTWLLLPNERREVGTGATRVADRNPRGAIHAFHLLPATARQDNALDLDT